MPFFDRLDHPCDEIVLLLEISLIAWDKSCHPQEYFGEREEPA